VGFKTVEEYIASFPPDVQVVLRAVRKTIRASAPQAEEKIAYGMAGYKLLGKPLVYFAGWKDHVGVYGLSATTPEFQAEIARYAGAKGSLRFGLDSPVPLELIGNIVRLKAQENREKAGAKARRR
jgi:uncharacterized protein YdhG (YjbR/CyaY superfamily)